MVLHELERQPHASRRIKWFIKRKHRIARHIAAPWTNVDSPSSRIVPVVRKRDRPSHSPLSTAVIENLLQLALRRVHIRRRLAKFQLDSLIRMVERRRFYLELAQRTRAVDRSPRPAMR